MSTLYEDCIAAGIPVDSHESDLYVKCCPESRELLHRHGVQATCFMSQIDDTAWYDVPFRFDPWWESRLRTADHPR